MTPPTAGYFVTGGTLPTGSKSYVERAADRELIEAVLRGEFCYILTARQMGKSSLMVRTAAKLRERSVAVAVLDLTAIGQNVTPAQWYDGLIALPVSDERDEQRAERVEVSDVVAERDAGGRHRAREEMCHRCAMRKGL